MDKDTEPAQSGVAVTPADSNLPNGTCRALWVGGTGNLSLLFAKDTVPVTISAVPAGTLLQFSCKQVRAATTATLIVALY